MEAVVQEREVDRAVPVVVQVEQAVPVAPEVKEGQAVPEPATVQAQAKGLALVPVAPGVKETVLEARDSATAPEMEVASLVVHTALETQPGRAATCMARAPMEISNQSIFRETMMAGKMNLFCSVTPQKG